MSDAKTAWGLLVESVGGYEGRGVNHEKQNFTGRFILKSELKNRVLALTFSATGDNGEAFHMEKSWLGFDITGALNLYVCSTNHPAIVTHVFDRIEAVGKGEQKIVFKFGNVSEKNSFREEISLTLAPTAVEYSYSWGMPGGEFETRSGARMPRV